MNRESAERTTDPGRLKRPFAEKTSETTRIFAINANGPLSERLDAFESHRRQGDHVLRTMAVKTFTLTHSIDRDEYSNGKGLELRKYERSLQKVAPPHTIRLDPLFTIEELKEGALLTMYMQMNSSDRPLINSQPMFDGSEEIRLNYFIPRVVAIGDLAIKNLVDFPELKNAKAALQDSLTNGEARVLRPRLMTPTLNNWSERFTPLGSTQPIPIRKPRSRNAA